MLKKSLNFHRPVHKQKTALKSGFFLAGAIGLEPTTYGFGDRCSTN